MEVNGKEVSGERLRELEAQFVSVSTAAEILSITSSAVNQRITRGTIKAERLNPESPKSRYIISMAEMIRIRSRSAQDLLPLSKALEILGEEQD